MRRTAAALLLALLFSGAQHSAEAGVRDHTRQHHPGHYLPRIIETGIVGELFTQVTDGLEAGEVIVTTGSFFVDAEYKLQRGGGSHAHSHH